jgi:2,4-dienoyl-CoA reductase-like NADH-dependent reductase (Old Yellow Enzyme family)
MPGLFSPLTIKHFTLRNRIVLPPMANNLSDDSGSVTDAHLQHYVRRAKAGVGMVIVEHAYVGIDGRVNRNQLGIHHDDLLPGLHRLAMAVKDSGAVVGIQITHGGGRTTRATTGIQPLAPSALTVPRSSEPAQALTQEQMVEIRDAFVDAARRALNAGFDFVEIHGAHGYLFNFPINQPAKRATEPIQGRLRSH